jgi:hypothetical protein
MVNINNKIIMKTMILIILIGCLFIGLSCCSTLFPDEKLTLQRIDYNGNELRTDGYYYCYFAETGITVVIFLYKNGIILSPYASSTQDLGFIEQEMVKYYGKYHKTDWGVFVIDSDAIQYERWTESPSGVTACVYRKKGYIENDITFHITESYYSGRNETKQIDEVWHFKQFENKPDSTNNYIK